MKLMKFLLLILAVVFMNSCEQTVDSENRAPVVESVYTQGTQFDNGKIGIGEEVILTCVAKDLDEDQLTYNWTVAENDQLTGTLIGSGSSITWTAPAKEGNYVVTCKVTDTENAESAQHLNLHVIRTTYVTSIEVNNGEAVTPETTIPLVCEVKDIENAEDFSYTWSLEDGAKESTPLGYGRKIQWRTPEAEGNYNILCKVVKDADGVEVEARTVVCSYNFGSNDPVVSIDVYDVNHGNIEPNDVIRLSCTNSDTENNYVYEWLLDTTPLAFGKDVQWRTPMESGAFLITCQVKDAEGTVRANAQTTIYSYGIPHDEPIMDILVNGEELTDTLFRPNSVLALRCFNTNELEENDNDDNDVDENYSYEWTQSLPDGSNEMPVGKGQEIQWRTPAENGTYVLNCVAKDAEGMTYPAAVTICSYANLSLNVAITSSIAEPYAGDDVTLIANVSTKGKTNTKAKEAYTYEWKLDGNVIGNEKIINWVPAADATDYYITCEVSNNVTGDTGFAVKTITTAGPFVDVVFQGYIYDSYTDMPVAGATVTWYDNFGNPMSLTTNHDGYFFTLDPDIFSSFDIGVGDIYLVEAIFSAPGYAECRAELKLGLSLDAGIYIDKADYFLHPLNSTLEGQVYVKLDDENNVPANNVTVELTYIENSLDAPTDATNGHHDMFVKMDMQDLTQDVYLVNTDENGKFAFPNKFAAGSYTLDIVPYYYEANGLTYYLDPSVATNVTLEQNGFMHKQLDLVDVQEIAPIVLTNNMEYADDYFNVEGNIELTFSKDIVPSSFDFDFTRNNEDVQTEVTWVDARTLIVNPVNTLRLESDYTFEINVMRSPDGSEYNTATAADIVYNFKTEPKLDLISSNIVTVDGDDYMHGFAVDGNIELKFDKEIDATRTVSELEDKEIRLVQITAPAAADGDIVEVTVSATGNVVTIDPQLDLDSKSMYRLYIKVWENSPSSNAFFQLADGSPDGDPIVFETATTDDVPAQVENLRFANVYNNNVDVINLTWDLVPEVVDYRVYAKTVGSTDDFLLVQEYEADPYEEDFVCAVGYEELRALDADLFQHGKTVTFNVVGVNDAGEGSASDVFALNYEVPGQVTGLVKNTFVAIGTEAISFTWNVEPNADWYVVEVEDLAPQVFIRDAADATTVTEVVDFTGAALDYENPVEVTVTSYNKRANGAASATYEVLYDIPEQVTNFANVAYMTYDYNELMFSWGEEDDKFTPGEVDGFRIYANNTGDTDDNILVHTKVLDTTTQGTVADEALISISELSESEDVDGNPFAGNATVNFYIVAYNDAGESVLSDPINLTYANPAAIAGFAKTSPVAENTTAIDFNWSHSAGAEYYRVYAKETTEEDYVLVYEALSTGEDFEDIEVDFRALGEDLFEGAATVDFRLVAYNKGGSVQSDLTYNNDLLAAPAGFQLAADQSDLPSIDYIRFEWTAVTDADATDGTFNPTGYRIYADGEFLAAVTGDEAEVDCSTIAEDIPAGVDFTISTVNAAGEGVESADVTLTVAAPTVVPTVALDGTVVVDYNTDTALFDVANLGTTSNTYVQFWAKLDGQNDEYQLVHSVLRTAETMGDVEVDFSVLSNNDLFTEGHQVTFKVRVANISGVSEYSAELVLADSEGPESVGISVEDNESLTNTDGNPVLRVITITFSEDIVPNLDGTPTVSIPDIDNNDIYGKRIVDGNKFEFTVRLLGSGDAPANSVAGKVVTFADYFDSSDNAVQAVTLPAAP